LESLDLCGECADGPILRVEHEGQAEEHVRVGYVVVGYVVGGGLIAEPSPAGAALRQFNSAAVVLLTISSRAS
jgi:hypothetical protein